MQNLSNAAEISKNTSSVNNLNVMVKDWQKRFIHAQKELSIISERCNDNERYTRQIRLTTDAIQTSLERIENTVSNILQRLKEPQEDNTQANNEGFYSSADENILDALFLAYDSIFNLVSLYSTEYQLKMSLCAQYDIQAVNARDTTTCNISNLALGELANTMLNKNNREISRDFNVLVQYTTMYNSSIEEFQNNVNNHAQIYAVSQDQPEILDRHLFKKVAVGDFLKATITNEAFDAVLFTLPVQITRSISYDETDDLYDKKAYIEYKYLSKVYKYVKQNGLFAIIMPFFRLHEPVTTFLARRFSLMYAYAFPKLDKNIALFVFRAKTETEIADRFDERGDLNILNNIYKSYLDGTIFSEETENSDIDLQLLDYCGYDIECFNRDTTQARQIHSFYGEKVDLTQYAFLLRGMTTSQEVLDEYKKERSDADIKPILPLSSGQVGLALASGIADGIITDEYGYKHVIKGCSYKTDVIKKTVNYATDESVSDSITEEVTNTNTVEINYFTPTGVYNSIGMDTMVEGINEPIIEEIGVPLETRNGMFRNSDRY
jgi:hypothetical protein